MSISIPRRYVGMAESDLIESIVEMTDFDTWLDHVAVWQHKNRKTFDHVIGTVLLIHSQAELAKVHCIIHLLETLSPEQLVKFCEDNGVKVAKKQHDLSESELRHKIISKCYVANVFTELNNRIKRGIVSSFPLLMQRYSTSKQKYESAMSFYERNNMNDDAKNHVELYFLATAVGEFTLSKFVMSKFSDDMWELYQNYLFDSFATVYLHRLKGQKMAFVQELSKIDGRIKTLEENIAEQLQETQQVREELYQSKEIEKELRKQVYETNLMAEVQTSDHRNEVQQLLNKMARQDEELNLQSMQIHMLTEHIERETEDDDNAELLPLKGNLICVVGHPTRKSQYKEVVEKYGGMFEFVPSEGDSNLNMMEGPLRRADIIMFLTTYTNHSTSNKIKKIADDSKVVYLNTGGIKSFEQELLQQVIPLLQNQAIPS